MFDVVFNRLRSYFEEMGTIYNVEWDTSEATNLFNRLLSTEEEHIRYSVEQNLYATIDDFAVNFNLQVDGTLRVEDSSDLGDESMILEAYPFEGNKYRITIYKALLTKYKITLTITRR